MDIRVFGRLLFGGFGVPRGAFRESNFLPEPKPKSLFEALRSKRFVRRMGVALVLVMASTFAALQVSATDTGADSEVDYSLVLAPGQFATRTDSTSSPHDLGGDLTFEAWVLPTLATPQGSIVDKDTSYSLSMRGGTFQVAFQSSSSNTWTWRNTGVPAIPNQWQHVAFTKQGNIGKLYINGTERWSLSNSTWFPTALEQNNNPLAIGSRETFTGRVDEVRIWASARTATQILENMHRNHQSLTPVTNLRSYYDFNEDPGTSAVYDRSVNSAQMTLSGSPSRRDVKELTSVSGGETVIVFPRTYLPGVSGWTVPTNATNFKALVVAGGGGGGGDEGGGGGAGGFQELQPTLVSGSTPTVIVGQGGFGADNDTTPATNGQDSALGNLVSIGGGAGGDGSNDGYPSRNGSSGGSGGGRAGENNGGTAGAGTAGQGFEGAQTSSTIGNGGGGAAAAGSGVNGGAGKETTIISPSIATSLSVGQVSGGKVYFAGGGGGGGGNTSTSPFRGTGGTGGGGAGGSTSQTVVSGTANTGGGGGGSGSTVGGSWGIAYSGASGGSGVVIVRYTPSADLAVDLEGITQSFLTGPVGVIGTTAFTVEGWIFLDSNIGITVFSQGASSTDKIYVATLATPPSLSGNFYVAWGGSTEADTGFQAPVDRWAHIALVRDSNGIATFFVDGVSVWNSGATSNKTTPATGGLRVGYQIGGGSLLNGQIDQLKVWDSNLTASEIANSMHSYGDTQSNGAAVKSGASLRAHYDFNEPTNTRIEPDRSGNNRSLTYGSAIGESSYKEDRIIQRGTAFSSLQRFVKFNRSYLAATGGWTQPASVSKVKLLAVGGGGGAGGRHAGGGGAGGFIETEVELTQQVNRITVGVGGLGGPVQAGEFTTNTGKTARGGPSIALGLTAVGGGAGAGRGTDSSLYSGGSGGGTDAGSTINTPGAGTAGQGNSGGQGNGGNGGTWTGGGGGGAGAAGSNAGSSGQGGKGGDGRASTITGVRTFYAGGGGGASNGIGLLGGAGGSGGGGAGGSYSATGSSGSNGLPGSGGGGGGGGFSDSIWALAGGSGGSGIVILSYGATLEVSQTPGGARAGSLFQRAIQIQLRNEDGTNYSGADQQVTLTASSSSVLQQTIGGVTTNITSTTTTSRDGVATFSNIGFQSGVSGNQTLTVTSDAFVGTSLSITPTFVASTVNITNSGSTNGTFVDGLFQSSTNSTANILNTDLQTAMASGSVLVESSGSISVQANVQSNTAGSGLTLKAATHVTTNASLTISTSNGHIVFWPRANSTQNTSSQSGDGHIIIGNGVTINSNGGAVILAGSSSVDANGFPSGHAYTNASSGTRYAIQLGDTDTASGITINSGGGQIRIHAQTGSSALQAYASRTSTSSQTTINSGTGRQEWNIIGGNSGDNVFESWGAITIQSAAPADPASPAINFYVRQTNSANTSTPIQQQDARLHKFVASGGGDIAVNISTANTGIYAFDISRAIQFLASSGAITVNTGVNGLNLTGSTAANPMVFGAESAGSSSSNITLIGDRFIEVTGNSATSGVIAKTSGTVTIEPSSASFTGSHTFDSTWAFSGASGLRIGKTGNTSDVTVSVANSVAGNFAVIGGAIAISANQTTTNAGNITITPSAAYSGAGALNSAGTLSITGGTSITPTGNLTAAGNLTLSGSTKTLIQSLRVTSSGGDISITSGPVADYAVQINASTVTTDAGRIRLSGNSTSTEGIYLYGTTTIGTNSGDIELLATSTGTAWGTNLARVDVVSNSGDILIDGGARGLLHGWGAVTNIGATSSGSASGDILVRGARYWSGSTGVNYKTTGSVIIESSSSAFTEDTTLSNHTFASHTTLRIGTSTNNRAVTLSGTGSVSISGDYQVYGTAITQNVAATSTSGNITFTGSGAFANSGALNAGSGLYITGASTVTATGAWTTNAALDVSATGNISTNNISAITVNTGYLSLVSSGGSVTLAKSISAPGEITITGTSVTATDSITAGGVTQLTATSATGDLTVDGNVTITGVGNELILKSKRSVINAAAATIRTNYAPMVFWADSDGNSTGVNRTAAGSVFNTVNGSTSDTVTGGGDMIFAGGSSTDANGYPTGFAFSDGTYSGFHSGHGTCAKTYYYTGGGDFIARGYTTGAMDAVSTNCSIQVWANSGQIEIDGQSSSNGLAIQIQRGGNTTQSEFFSSSNSSPAIRLTAISNTGLGFVSGNNQSTANRVMIQATGTGGVVIDGNGGSQDTFDVGLNSTNILSNGPITINAQSSGWNGGIFTSSLFYNHSGAQSTLGYCAASTCTGSRVTSSSADVSITVNRLATWASDTNLKINTSGAVSFVPTDAQGFQQFVASTAQGLAFSSDVSGLTIGKDQTTNAYTGYSHEFYPEVKITGPIRIYYNQINIRSGLETTGAGSEIRLKTISRIYLESSKSLKTNGGDVVLWTAAGKSSGTTVAGTNIYLNSSSSITTSGGKIWLAGGLDDGGTDAQITTSRGKWDSVVAADGLPDGYSVGYSSNNTWDIGVFLDTGVQLKSGGGDIFMAGALGLTSTSGYGHVHLNTGTVVDSGAGRIAMWGRSLGSSATNGIVFHWGNDGSPTIISSNAPTSDAITIYSDSSAGSTWSRGITGIWYAAYSSARGYQGTQILATASGGGITMTGIGANAGNDDSKGIWLDFTDVMAIDGPITLNGDSNNSNKWGVGVAFGWENNVSNAVRLGGWHAGPTGTSGGGVITTPGGVTADFTNSSSDVTINTDSFYTRESGVYGVYFGTTGDIAILPADRSSGLISATSDFEFNHNENAFRFGNLHFPITPTSIIIGRSDTTTQLTPASALTATGEISVTGGVVTTSQSISGGTVRVKSNTGASTLGAAVSAGAGGVTVTSGGAVTVSGNQTTTNSGNFTVTASGDFSGTGTITSAGDLLISSAAATVGAVFRANGDLDIVSSSLTVSRSLSSTVGRVYLKSSDNIIVQAGSSTTSKTAIQTGGGDITLQADSDGNNDGGIWIQNNTNISTAAGAGDIVISGGTNPLTGFATVVNSDGSNKAGVQFGAMGAATTFTPGYADGITIASGIGDVLIRGKAIGNGQGRGILLPLSSTTANKTSITGKDVTFVGSSESGVGTSWYGVEFGNSSSQTISTIKTLVSASGVLSITGTSSNYDGVVANGNYEFIGDKISITGSGPRNPIRLCNASQLNDGCANSSITAGNRGFEYSATKSGTVDNSSPAVRSGSFSSTGPVSLVYDAATSTGQLAIQSAITATNTDVTIRANNVNLSGSINAGTGVVKFEPFTSSRSITAGTEVTNTLSLTATELGAISANTLRLETGGDLTVTGNLDFTGKVSTLAIRAGGNVSAASNLSVVVSNLGIEAGGTIDWPGTGGEASVVALNASSVTFNQSANYSVATVDGIDPEFGVGVKFLVENIDRTNTVDRFMAVTFNPPPVVKIQDKFGNVLAANNLSAANYTVSASMSVIRTDTPTPSLSGTVATRSGGTHTYDTMRVIDGTGKVSISFTVERSDGFDLAYAESSSSPQETSVAAVYEVKAGFPSSIVVSMQSSARAGMTGLSPTATLKDSGGGTLTTGDYANATITVAVSTDTGRISIVSGGSAQASNGVASFSNLIVGGLTGSNYVLTFSVQYRDANGVTQTVTRDSDTFTLNAGDATALSLNSSSQTVANRATLSDIVVGLKDAFGNTTASLSNVPISLAVSNGVNRGLTPTLVGYSSPVDATTPSSTATFSGLELQGKVDSYDLVFSATGLSSAVHRVELTHGEASALLVSAPTTADNDRTFGSDVVVDIVDPDENPVTTGSQSTQTISLSATTTLTGTREISATAGRATFSGLKLLGTLGTKTLTASISSPSAIEEDFDIELGFGEATKLVLTTEAAGIANRTIFNTAPVITVQDSSGNTVTNYSSPITVSSSAVGASGPATLTGTLSRTASSGVATFSGLELQGKVGDYLLSFNSTRSDSTALASVSQQVSLTHGVATNVLVSAPATASNNRELSSAVSVQIRDQDNNVVLSSAQEITLSVSNATLSGTVARLANQGVASFPALTITGTEGTKRITATVTGTALAGFADVELGFGQATRLSISQAASGAVSRELFTTQPIIKVLDVSGNEVDDFEGELSVSVSGVGTVLSGTTSRSVSGGEVVFTDLVLRGPVDSYTLLFEATESGTNRTITQTSQNLYLAHGEATQVIIDSVNTVANAADLGTVTVEIKDADGNLITTGTPEVELSITGSTGSTTLTGTRTANANTGTATFTGLSILGLEENKTLTATVSSLGVSGTKTIALTYGSATQLALISGVTESANRQAFAADSVIEARDSSGNPVDDFVGDVTVVASSGSGVVSGTLTRLVSSARAVFDDLSLVGTTGSYVLTFSSTGVSSVTQSVEVAHGVATTLELEVSPNAVNNQTITDVVVRIKDANGNLVTTGTPSISLEASAAELTGTLVRNAVSGVATFTGLKFLGTTGTKSVNASLASLALNAITSYVTVSAGVATEIVLTTSATGAVNRAGISTVPVVTIRDISGNTVIDSSATVTVSVSPAGADLSGTTSRTPVNGVVSFAGLGLNGQVGQYTLSFASSGLATITQTIDLTHGAAVKLAIGTSATTARAGIGFGTQPVIRILDEDNNLVTTGASSSATVAAALTGSPAGVVLAGDLDKEAVGGIATFTDLRLNGEVGTYNIEYSSGALQVIDQDLELLAGNVTALRIATGPAGAIAGAGFASDVEVELVDAYQNVVLSDSTTDVTATLVASSDVSSRGVTTTTVRVANGVADFASLNYTLAGDHKISFSDGTRQVVSDSFTITHAEAAKLAWVTQPGLMRNDIVVGTAPTVRVLDDYNNLVLSGPTVTVTASVTGSNSGDISNISGNSNTTSSGSEVVTLASLKLKGKVSDYVIRMTGSAGGASFFIDSDPVALSFGLPSQIVLTQQADGARAGVAFDTQPELEIRDNSDNLVADSSLRVTATVSGRTLVGTSSVNASGGVVSFADLGIQGSAATGLVIRYATSYSGNTLEDTQSIDLTAGDAVKLSILQQPETVMTREEFDSDIQIQLLDQYDNPVPTDSVSQVSVELYKGLSRALATGGSVLTLTAERASAGVARFTGLTLPVEPGTDYFLKFSLAGFTITSSQFEVLPGVATRIAITQQPSSLSGVDLMKTGELLPVQPEVTLYDADNYIARGASGNVTVSIASGTGGSLTEGVTTATISNGVARFSGVKLVGTPRQGSVTAQLYRLSFSHTPAGGSAVTSDPSSELSVTNNNAVSLTLIRGAADGQAGEVFEQQPIVHIVDRYGNIVETGTDAALVVRATSPDGGTLLGANRAASKGVARFATLSLGGQVNRDYTLVFSVLEKPSLTNASQTGVRVSYGFTDRISIRQAPASLSGADLTKTGSALAVQPIIEVHDAYNNVVENASLPISVTLVRVGASLDVKDRVINGSMTTVNGVASFSGLSVVARPGENYHLSFATPGLTPVSTENIPGYSPLVVRHADPSVLEIVRQPASVSADASRTKTGSPLAVQPQLRLLDFDGNLATEINTEAVTATVISETGGRVETTGGINQAVFSGGIATFDNLTVIAVPSSEQVLRFSTTVRGNTLTSVNSSGFSLTFADAYQLAVLQAPCAGAVLAGVCDVGVTGEDLTVQPVIEIQDRFGNRVTDYVGQVTVQTVISGAVLRDSARQVVSSVSVNVSGGLASFGVAGAPSLNLVATPGVDVELSFTSGSLLSATSDPIRVRAAQASQLVVITQPVAGRTGSTLPVVPVIELRDEFGNRVLSDDVTRVSVASMAGPLQPGGTVTGETTVTATAGRATFTGIGFIGTPRANYTLRFTANDVDGNPIAPIESEQFFAINAEAAKINIAQTGTTGRTGDLIGETVVELLDAFDNRAEDNSSTTVRVSIVGGTAGSTRFVNAGDQTLNTVQATVSGGVVRFTDLRVVGLPGESLRLRFDAASHEPAFTAPFVLTHGLAASLSVTRNPVADLSGVALTTQPQLALFDRYGNAATTDNSTVVTASIYSGSGGALTAGATATAVNGIVTFSGLTATGNPGTTYLLRFSASTFAVDDLVGFRVKKNAVTTLSYAETSFVQDGPVNPSFASDSDGASSRSFTTSTPAICSVDSSTGVATMKAVGDCVITVTIPTTVNYYSLAPVTATLKIIKAAQPPISITTTLEVDHMGTLPLSYTGSRGTGAVIYSVSGDCRVIGSTLLAGAAGSLCEVRVERRGDSNYLPSISDWSEVTINKVDQEALVIGNATSVIGGSVELFTWGGSGNGAVTYFTDPSQTQCSISASGTLNRTTSGNCDVYAIKAESAYYLEERSGIKTFSFSKLAQTISFTSAVPDRATVGQTYAPVAVASSGLSVSYTISSGSGTICSVATASPFSVAFNQTGICEITATQAGDATYDSVSATQILSVGLRNQTITFAAFTESMVFGTPSFMLTATASSGLPVSYTVSGGGSAACTVTNGRVSLTRSGMCVITASQPGNLTEFAPATPVTQVLTVTPDKAGAPHLVSIGVGDRSITAKFMAPGYLGGSAISAYRMEAKNNSTTYANFACDATPGTACTITGLPRNTIGSFEVRVAAITEAGIGTYSDWSRPIDFREAGLAVRNLVAPISGDVLRLAWDAPMITEGFSSYEIYVWPQSVLTRPSATAATVRNLNAGGINLNLVDLPETTTGLQIEVVTVVDPPSTLSELQRTAIAKTIGFTTPSAPARIALSDMEEELLVAWSPPLQDGGQPIMGYQVFVNDELSCSHDITVTAQTCRDADAMSFTVTDLQPGTEYKIQVAAMNSLGLGELRTIFHSTPAPPSAGGSSGSIDGFPGLPVKPGKPGKPGSGNNGPNVLDPDSWNPGQTDSSDNPVVPPAKPTDPSGPDSNAQGQGQSQGFEWLPWMVGGLLLTATASAIARRRRLRRVRSSNLVSDMG